MRRLLIATLMVGMIPNGFLAAIRNETQFQDRSECDNFRESASAARVAQKVQEDQKKRGSRKKHLINAAVSAALCGGLAISLSYLANAPSCVMRRSPASLTLIYGLLYGFIKQSCNTLYGVGCALFSPTEESSNKKGPTYWLGYANCAVLMGLGLRYLYKLNIMTPSFD